MSPLDDPEVCRSILDSLSVGVYLVDPDRKIILWNAGAERMTGYLRHEVVGRHCRDDILVHSDHQGHGACTSSCPLHAAIHEGQHGESHLYFHHRAGHRVPVLVRAIPLRDRSGAIIGAAEIFEEPRPDSYVERRHHTGLAQAYADPVTQLPNHNVCQVRLRIFLSTFAQESLPFSILLIRVSDIQAFSAEHGAEAGRLLMRAIGETLANTVRHNDFAGRWSDDEFLMIFANCEPARVPFVGERICAVAAAASIHWWGDELSASVSFGEASAEKEDTIESMISRAQQMIQTRRNKAAGA
jgi:diguanylate cyclase (GGDEF)-like protein/PAS domain S-box-containing protein